MRRAATVLMVADRLACRIRGLTGTFGSACGCTLSQNTNQHTLAASRHPLVRAAGATHL